MRPVLLATACLLVALAHPVAGVAYWSAGGGGAGTARGADLPAGPTASATATGRSVTVTWTASAFAGGTLGDLDGGGYWIARYAEGGTTPIAPVGSCAGVVRGAAATVSCVEGSVPPGR